jgi:hypothetical protein
MLTSFAQVSSPLNMSNQFYEIEWLEPLNPYKEVGKYEKLEFGLKIMPELENKIKQFIVTNNNGLNPYNPEDISVEFNFISPSEKQHKIYAFYYQDFEVISNNWAPIETKFNWRVRFSPDEIGDWRFSFQIITKDKTIDGFGSTFECKTSNQKGILKRNHNGDNSDRYFYLSEPNEAIFLAGHNIAHSAYYQLTPSKAEQHKLWLTELAQNNGNFFRLEMGAQNGLPDWADAKNYSTKMPQMWEFDQLVEHAQKLELYFILFRHHTEVCTGESWDVSKWDNNPYKIAFNLKSREEYFSNEEVLKWQKNNLRYLFSRWGYSTSFAFYEYQEVDMWYRDLQAETGYNDKKAITLFKDWYLKHKNYIKTDLGYNKKLFINTYAGTPNYEFNKNSDGMFANSDAIGFHKYGQAKDINYSERYDKAIDLWNAWNKPLLVEEMGVNAGSANDFLPIYKCSNVEFHNSIWATSFMGGAGTGLNWWWDRGIHDFEYYKDYNALVNFFKDEKITEEKYTTQKWHSKISINRALIENYALTNLDQTKVIGWVHNASHYWRNIDSPYFNELLENGKFTFPHQLKDGYVIGGEQKEPTDYSQKADAYTKDGGVQNIANETFEIKGLKTSGLFSNKQWYKVVFYSTLDNSKVAEQTHNTNVWGKLKPTYPEQQDFDFSYKITYLGEGKKAPKL